MTATGFIRPSTMKKNTGVIWLMNWKNRNFPKKRKSISCMRNTGGTLPLTTTVCLPKRAISTTTATGTVSYWTTGTSAYVRSSFPIRFSASGSGLRCFPPTGCFMRSFTRQGIRRNVPSAARSLRQPLTVSNTAPSAGNVSPADKPPSA